MTARAGADRNDAVDALLHGLARMAHADDIVEDDAAIRMHGFDDVFGRSQARNDDWHLVAHADFHVGHKPRVATVHDLVDREWRNRGIGVGLRVGCEARLDVHDPFLQALLRSCIERRERSDNARRALRHDEVGHRDDEHRCANERDAQVAREDVG